MKVNFKNKKNNSLWRATVFFGILGVILVVGGVVLLKNKESEFKLITDEGEMSLFVINHSQEELDEYYRKADEFYAQDIYGGDTPEETLELYIQALEVSDFELASKYFVFRDQERELREISSLENNVLEEQISYLKTKDKKFNHNDFFNTYEVDILFEGKYYLATKFVKNKQADIWKLESI